MTLTHQTAIRHTSCVEMMNDEIPIQEIILHNWNILDLMETEQEPQDSIMKYVQVHVPR